MIVMPDADPSQVVGSLMGAAYGSAGERCMAISVAVCVGDDVADNLIDSLSIEIDGMRVGPGVGLPEEAHMGPVISKEHCAKIKDYISIGVEEGATLVRDGRDFVYPGNENGYFVGPTLFDNVKQGMRIYNEEIFGPVLCVVRASSYQEALDMINAHEYGNGTSIFTRDGDTARQFCEDVQVGMVGVNVPIPVPMAFHSFGGWKRSLFGPLHMHGPDGVRFYTRMKTITARWPTGLRAGAEFSMPTMK
jgi:malonate-semialdehyde dehydrogenase (acetylating) / methylmalonate-semialdehyde dehydrogenase